VTLFSKWPACASARRSAGGDGHQVAAEYSVLLQEMLDDLPLAAVDPPGHGENAALEDKTVHSGERTAAPGGAKQPADFRSKTARFAPDEFWDRTLSVRV
jgi:hypothetical protein